MRNVKELTRHMKANGLNQSKIASRLDISRAAVSGWFVGRCLPHAGMFPKLAKILNVTPMELTYIFEKQRDSRSATSHSGFTASHTVTAG